MKRLSRFHRLIPLFLYNWRNCDQFWFFLKKNFWRNFYLRFCVIKIKHWQHEFHNVFVKQVNKYPSSCFKARETEALESHSLVFAMMWDTGSSGIGIYRVLNYKTWCSCLWKTVRNLFWLIFSIFYLLCWILEKEAKCIKYPTAEH